VDTVHECDRQTDRRTDRITITKTVQRRASHVNRPIARLTNRTDFEYVMCCILTCLNFKVLVFRPIVCMRIDGFAKLVLYVLRVFAV